MTHPNHLNKETLSLAWDKPDVSSDKGRHDENFPVGSFLIHHSLRPTIFAYYNFARVGDDISDNNTLTSEEKIARLEALDSILNGACQAPNRADAQTAVKARQALLMHNIPLSVASDLLTAFKMDALKTRYETWEDLLHYCTYSANPVGRFLLYLHQEKEKTFASSDALCTSLQILNHIQDISPDLKKINRCYVPTLWLHEAGVNVDDLKLNYSKNGVKSVIGRMLKGVDSLNDLSAYLPYMIETRSMRMEAAVIVHLSNKLTEHLKNHDPLAERVDLSKWDFISSFIWALGFIIKRNKKHII